MDSQHIQKFKVLIKSLQLSAVVESVLNHLVKIAAKKTSNRSRTSHRIRKIIKSPDKTVPGQLDEQRSKCSTMNISSESNIDTKKIKKSNSVENIKVEMCHDTVPESSDDIVSKKLDNDSEKVAVKRSLSDNEMLASDYSGDTVDYSSDVDSDRDLEMKEKSNKPTLEYSLDSSSSQRGEVPQDRILKAHLLKAKCGFCGMISRYDVTKRHIYEQHFDEIMNEGQPSLKEYLKIKCLFCGDEVVREDYSVHVLLKHPAPAEKKTNRGRYFKMKVGCLFCDVIVRNVFYMDHLKDAHPEKAEVFTSNTRMKRRDGVKFERAKPGALNAASHLLPMICVYCENPREIICDQYKPHILQCHPNFADINVSNVNCVKVIPNVASEQILKPTREKAEKAKYLFVDRSRHLPEKPPPPDVYVCCLCGEGCTSKSNFFDHGRKKHGFKTVHCCNYCHKFYKNAFERINHEDDEHAIEKYLCETCGKDFVRSTSLKIHKENVHLGQIRKSVLFKKKAPRKENVLCNYCGKAFNRTGNLKEHISTSHSGVRSFKCDKCDKAFFSQKRLHWHEKIHVNVKRFTCKFCSFKTNRRDHLISHLRIHTGEKPFRCSFCGNRFRISLSLRFHLENVHSVKLTGQRVFQQFFQPENDGPSEANKIFEDMYGDSDEEVKLQGGPIGNINVGKRKKQEEQLTKEDMEGNGVTSFKLPRRFPHTRDDQNKPQEVGKKSKKNQSGNSPLPEHLSSEAAQHQTARSRLEVISEPTLMYDEGTSNCQNSTENEQGYCLYPGAFQPPYNLYY